jgi:hypothetical protein
MSMPRAGCNIGRGIGHIEEDDDLPAWLALESATMFFHGLIAGWAPRCHWVMETPETANSSTALRGSPKNNPSQPAKACLLLLVGWY